MTRHLIQFGCRGCGKLEQQRMELGMTVEEHIASLQRQHEAYEKVMRLESELAIAREEYYKACLVDRK